MAIFSQICDVRRTFSRAPPLNLHTQAPACKDHACKNNPGCKNKILRVQKVPNEDFLYKTLGCKNIPLVRPIFGLDEPSSYMQAPVYFAIVRVKNENKVP